MCNFMFGQQLRPYNNEVNAFSYLSAQGFHLWIHAALRSGTFTVHFLLTLSPGESHSGAGASTPDERVQWQTHDHPPRGHLVQRWTLSGGQHPPLPHPTELVRNYPCRGGASPTFDCRCCPKGAHQSVSALFLSVSAGRGFFLQPQQQRRVCAENSKSPVHLARDRRHRRGDGRFQARGGIPGGHPQPGARGQGAW